MKTSLSIKKSGYLEFFGLTHNPFPVAPDIDSFFISDHIDQIITEIVHGIHARKGFLILTGDVGLGKTTMSRRIMDILEKESVETSLVFHTTFQDVELLREINRDFGLESGSSSFGDQMKLLNDFLLEKNRHGKNCAIIIDDAQNLEYKSLELVRMISNLEANQQKLVQVLLVGQPELMEQLKTKGLRQLKSRIIIRKEPLPLSLENLKSYLVFKLNRAGNSGRTSILKSAYKKIHRITKGNFRQVNTLMDRCLYAAFNCNSTKISKKIVADAYKDLPTYRSMYKRAGAITISILLFICVAAGTACFISDKAVSTLISCSTPLSYAVESGSSYDIKKKSVVPESIINFLNDYNLLKYKYTFNKALQTDTFSEIKDTIFNGTGYKLIRLGYLPDHIRETYGVLSYPNCGGTKENYFLFWKPDFIIKKFYYSYQGIEIRLLQELLKKVHLYSYNIDGIAGERLMTAVVNYQAQRGLPVSGYPDEETLFLLHNENL